MIGRKFLIHSSLAFFSFAAAFGLLLVAFLVPEINWTWWCITEVILGAVCTFSLWELDEVQKFILEAERGLLANGSASRGSNEGLEKPVCPHCGKTCSCEDEVHPAPESPESDIHIYDCCTRPVLPQEDWEDDDWRYPDAHWRNRRFTDTGSMSPSDKEIEVEPGFYILHEIDMTGDGK